MNKISIFFIMLFVMIFCACGSKEVDLNPQLPNVPKANLKPPEPPVKKVLPKYVYNGSKYRDPFIPLTGKGLAFKGLQQIKIPSIDYLVLKGIIDDGKEKMAILSGGGASYILKGSYLYDSRRRLVEGISGAIKKDSVIMIDASKKTKTIKIRGK